MTERASESDADFFKQRGFGLKIGFGQRPALLVIDMLKAFTNPQMMLGANLDNEIEAIKPLIAVAHERDIPVIFSTVIYNDADLKDAGIWALKQKGVVTLKGDSDGVEIDPRLDFRKTDSLLVKKYASCFFGTDLVSRLPRHGPGIFAADIHGDCPGRPDGAFEKEHGSGQAIYGGVGVGSQRSRHTEHHAAQHAGDGHCSPGKLRVAGLFQEPIGCQAADRVANDACPKRQ